MRRMVTARNASDASGTGLQFIEGDLEGIVRFPSGCASPKSHPPHFEPKSLSYSHALTAAVSR
jgi:hypothetical protein